MHPAVVAAAVSGSSPPYLVIFCNDSKKLYRANPDSESFVRYKYVYPLVRKVVHGSVALDDHEDVLPPLPAAVVTKVADMMIPSVSVVPTIENFASWKHCFLVESAGETLVVFKLETSMEVYKVKIGHNTLEKMQSICNRALFIGPYSCLSLDADKLPSIEANCIYFTSRMARISLTYITSRTGNKVR
jgi:hypothetical protein